VKRDPDDQESVSGAMTGGLLVFAGLNARATAHPTGDGGVRRRGMEGGGLTVARKDKAGRRPARKAKTADEGARFAPGLRIYDVDVRRIVADIDPDGPKDEDGWTADSGWRGEPGGVEFDWTPSLAELLDDIFREVADAVVDVSGPVEVHYSLDGQVVTLDGLRALAGEERRR
jgi:hypothetical protein